MVRVLAVVRKTLPVHFYLHHLFMFPQFFFFPAIIAALASAFIGVPVDAKISMTGEVTLRGAILPVGGIKEKILAANRGGIRMVLLPGENSKDVEKLTHVDHLTVKHVSTVEELLESIFLQENDEPKRKSRSSTKSTAASSASSSATTEPVHDHLKEFKSSYATKKINKLLLSAL
jgi:predicted S18 family serine protease